MFNFCFWLNVDREDAKKMAADPMYKLEHGVKDEQKSKAAQPTLGQLQVISPTLNIIIV